MSNPTRLTILAAIALAATTSIASAFPIIPLPPKSHAHPHSNTVIECRVRGDNFWIINFGEKVLDSGQQIAWTSPSTGDDGLVLLPKMLAPGEEVKLADVLSDDAYPGAPCSASQV